MTEGLRLSEDTIIAWVGADPGYGERRGAGLHIKIHGQFQRFFQFKKIHVKDFFANGAPLAPRGAAQVGV
jgi:hypothetical protein